MHKGQVTYINLLTATNESNTGCSNTSRFEMVIAVLLRLLGMFYSMFLTITLISLKAGRELLTFFIKDSSRLTVTLRIFYVILSQKSSKLECWAVLQKVLSWTKGRGESFYLRSPLRINSSYNIT